MSEENPTCSYGDDVRMVHQKERERKEEEKSFSVVNLFNVCFVDVEKFYQLFLSSHPSAKLFVLNSFHCFQKHFLIRNKQKVIFRVNFLFATTNKVSIGGSVRGRKEKWKEKLISADSCWNFPPSSMRTQKYYTTKISSNKITINKFHNCFRSDKRSNKTFSQSISFDS